MSKAIIVVITLALVITTMFTGFNASGVESGATTEVGVREFKTGLTIVGNPNDL